MNKANLQGQELEFNAGLLLVDNSSQAKGGEFLEISPGALAYLEIEDNILDVGLKGSVAIKNPIQILDRLKALRSTEDVLYFNVGVKDTQSPVKSEVDKQINFLALLENSSSITRDAINNTVVFNFEEAPSALLKKVSLTHVLNGSTNTRVKPVGEHIFDILELWAIDLGGQADIIGLKSDYIYGGTSNLASFWRDVNDSAYDVIQRLANHVELPNSLLPLLKLQSVEDSDKELNRKFMFKPMFSDRHREFLKAVIDGTSGDFSDVYGEEFVLSPESDRTQGLNSSPLFNTVESYQLLKVDIETAREKFWGDYMLDNGPINPAQTNLELYDFTNIVQSFEDNDLGKHANSAITVLKKNQKKIFKADKSDHENEDTSVIRAYANNITKKSFLFLNDTIVFNVKGNMIRKPGVFITINGGDVFGKSAPDNIWFVISVKHLFKELNYENEVVAVRLFGNSKPYGELVPAVESTGSTGSGVAPQQEQAGDYARKRYEPQSSSGKGDPKARNVTDFVKGFEGFQETAKSDYKQTSIGYGTKATPSEIANGTPITRAEAEARLSEELSYARNKVLQAQEKYGYSWSDNQIDALTSFTYNNGPGSEGKKGGLTNLLLGDPGPRAAPRSNDVIAEKMLLYNKAGNTTLGGLTSRRHAERNLFLNGYTTS